MRTVASSFGLLSLPFVVAGSLLLVACPKQDNAATSSGEAEPVQQGRFSGQTRSFVESLVANPTIGYAADDSGAAVIYEELRFSEDGSFSARTTVRLGEEPYECTESGTWSLDSDKSDSKSSGAITFTLQNTDCAGREAPKSWRGRVTISGNEIDIADI